MNISDYAKRLGIEPKIKAVSPLDIEAGKAGYDQYLADVDTFKKSQQQIISQSNNNKSWWDKVSGIILQANGMSSQMSDNPISSGFNQAVEAYRNIPEDNKPTDDWTDDERWAFGEKYSKDKNEAYSFAQQINNEHKRSKKQKQSEKISDWTTKNFGTGLLGSAASLGINAAYGGLGFLDALAQYAGRGKIEDHGVLLPHEISGAMQGAVAQRLNEKGGTINDNVPILGGKGWGDVYNLGMSLGQTALLAPSGTTGTLASYFGMAASQGITDARARGASDEQALAFGIITGLAEAIPEMIRMDSLLGVASAEGVQNVFKTVLKQAGEEGREELTTSIINEVADRWIMGGKSNYQQMVNALISNGMTPAQAQKTAFKKTIEGFAYDAISGAVSGGISGASGVGINRFNQQFLNTEANDKAKEILSPESEKLIEEGKKYNSTQKRAEILEKKLSDGKELTGYELRMLASQVREASRTADVDSVRNAVFEKMKSEGLEEGQAKRLAEIALNKAIGNEISKVQELILKRNPVATKVYSQMSEEMMQSDVGDSEWAKNTPIEKLRAQNKASMSERDTEQRVQSGIERLKAEIASRYGVDTKEYKINMDSIEGKFGEIENKMVYKPGENSKIHVDGISSSLTQDDFIELSAIEKIANELGIDVHVYETKADKKTGERFYTDKNGKRYSDSGFYDPSDNSIHIDLRAGENGEGTMLYTASHEVVHFIKENASEHYDALEALVTKELVNGGYSIDKLIDEQRKKLIESEKQKLIEEGVDPNTMSAEAFENLARERIGETNLENIAREEMVAEACQSFLASKNAVAEIKALKTKNKGLWTALKKFFTSLFTKINNVYKTVPPDSAQGKYIADMRKAVKPIRDAFMEGAVEAAKKNATSGSKTTDIKYKIRYPKFSENNISDNMSALAEMQPVASIDESKMKKTGKKPVEIFNDYFNSLGNNIYSDVFGDIALSRSSAKSEIRHGITAEKIASIEAIPSVITNGKVIFSATKAKSDVERIVVAAPIKIGNDNYYMGVMLQRDTQSQRLYLHNVASINAEEARLNSQDNSLTNWSDENDSRLFITSILQKAINVKIEKQKNGSNSAKIRSKSRSTETAEQDSAYLDAVKRGDIETAQKMVEAAAKANGYTDRLYHGTKTFGFTEFDPSLSDDKISIFAAGSPELAQTYSGKNNTKKISDKANLDNLSMDEVVKRLNEESKESYEGQELKIEYEIMKLGDVNKLIGEVNDSIETLAPILVDKIKEYANRMTTDFDDKDAKTHSRLIEAYNLLAEYEYKRLSTPLYVLLHYTDAFEGDTKGVEKLEYKIRLMNKLIDIDTSNGVVVKKDLDGYGITVLSFKKAREELETLHSSGNYALYGKPGRQLVIDGKGQTWNNIRNWISSAYYSKDDTYVKKDDKYYRLYDKNTNKQIFHGRTEINENNSKVPLENMHYIMVQRANNVLAIRSEYMKTTRDIAKFAKDEGYDSVKFENIEDNGGAGKSVGAGDVYVYFNANDLKSADTITYDDNDNIIPLSERFNPEKKDIRRKSRSYTAGQVAKMKADLSNEKVYSKVEVMRMIKRISPDLRNRSFESLADEIWKGLNTYTDRDEKQAFAKDIAQMFVDRMLIDSEDSDSKDNDKKHLEWEEANRKLAYLKPAIGSIGFRQKEIDAIKEVLFTKGYEYLRNRWGYKWQKGVKKRYYHLDEFIADLSREMPGMEHLKDMSLAEAIIEVDKLYSKLADQVTKNYKSTYKNVPDEFISNMRNIIENEIMDAYDELGEESKYALALKDKFERYEERISYWIAENVKTRSTARWSGIISNKALQIRDLKKGAFFNASQHRSTDTFKQSIEQLTKVQWRGNISEQGVRKVFADLRQWYTMDNPMLYDSNKPDADHLYNDIIAFYLGIIGDSKNVEKEAPIEPEEYPMIYEVMNHLYTIMKNYGKIFRAGRWVDAADIAKAYIGIIDANDKKRTPWTRVQSLYSRQFLEPMALARQADNYNPNGFFTQTMEELRRASINASIGEMKLRKEYDEFVNANQKYLMNAAKETVKYRGKDIPKLHLISLYMTMKRKQSREGLALNGFEYSMKTAWWDSEDVIKVPGYLPQSEKYNTELINRATEEQMRIISENFTDTDRQYMAILERLFNEKLRKMKIERDMERQGYTNALEGYYYPIIRGGIAKNVDTAKFTDVNRSTNSSFNKSTQQHAQQYLKIISADAMINRHIKDMCKYYYMSQAIENYNVLYHIDTTEGEPNLNNPRNIAERLKVSKVWEKDYDYFKKLVADIQGIRDNVYDTDGWRLIETIRGNYAKFALGLNAKVLFTQISSVIAAGDVIGFDSIISVNKNVGFVGTKEDIAKYCPIADVRSYEQTALKAMTLSDKIGKVSEKLMVGISVMDDFVVRRLFAACQVEAKKRGAGEIGSEENKIAAGKILEQIILETQQNSYATEKSSAMRSAHPLLRGLTMFTADGMKIISRIHEAAGEFKLAKKNGDTAAIKKARKKLARSIAVAASISVYLAAISTLFNWIYDRDEENKGDKPIKKVLRFSLDVVGNFIGALPLISDFYDRLVNGFEVEDVFHDSLNNLYGSVSNLCKDATDMLDGTRDRSIEDLNRDLRSLLYAVGQVSGMPVRNVYNIARGIVGIASPKAAYYIDSKFNETSLINDLKKSFDQGNDSKTTYIMSLIYDERLDERVSAEQSKEILRLYKKIDKKEIEGYSVIPKDIPDKIKRDGVDVELSEEQKEKIVSEYSKVIPAIDKLISSTFYLARSDKDRAYLIDYYHDKYYETAVNNALKIKDDKVAVYNAVGFSTYAKFVYVTRGIESDKDKNGNTISGSKKAKVTAAIEKASKDEEKKLLYLASLGYTLTEAQKKKLCKYLNSLSISESKKKSLAKTCNFTFKNGKIYP